MLEDEDDCAEAAFNSPLYAHLLLSLHLRLFGTAPPSLRNFAADMATHLSDIIARGYTPRGCGAEGDEASVLVRRRMQHHLNGLLGIGRGLSSQERAAMMLQRKLREVLWKQVRAPKLAPKFHGMVQREKKEEKTVQKQQREKIVLKDGE